jgi:hypothetical protein
LYFHKEKEMVAFRKWYPALAVFALTAIPAAAQSTGQPLACFANSGVPPVVRAEGYTELVGDLVITCSGGNPASPFLANFQLFLNTNITSRLVATSPDTSEALLMIDEPGLTRLDANGAQTTVTTPFCVSPGITSNSSVGLTAALPSDAPSLSQVPGLPVGGGTAPICNNTPSAIGTGVTAGPANQTFQQGTYTVFRAGRGAQPNQTIGGVSVGNENLLVWAGIPVVPPGSNRQRTFRITNVRANANGLGASQTLIPTQILAYISVFPQGTLPIDNPQQTVGYVQTGMLFDVRACGGGSLDSATITFAQCTSTSAQRDFFADPLRSGSLPANASLRFREGFQTAFKPQIIGGQEASIPGVVYNSESGFVRPETGIAGVADSGTRLAARFSNVPAGIRLFVAGTNNTIGSSTGTAAVLVTTDAAGASNIGSPSVVRPVPTAPFSQGTLTCSTNSSPAIEVPLTNGAGTAVWEVTASNPSSNETLIFDYAIAYRNNQSQGVPGVGTGTVIGNLAPFYTANNQVERMGTTILPIPRFAARTDSATALTINACQTNLLFPYVTNWAGFDTGIAIANTSSDPFSSPTDRQQAGRCTFNYYGRLANGNPPTTTRQQTDRDVATGETITMVLSSGGGLGLTGNPNFQGYIIATCDFQYAHGFAFITDGPIGQARVAEGYLALVLDGADAGRLRAGTVAEVRGH